MRVIGLTRLSDGAQCHHGQSDSGKRIDAVWLFHKLSGGESFFAIYVRMPFMDNFNRS